MKKKILIIGGGASGLMAAITAAGNNAEVTICEKNDRVDGCYTHLIDG